MGDSAEVAGFADAPDLAYVADFADVAGGFPERSRSQRAGQNLLLQSSDLSANNL